MDTAKHAGVLVGRNLLVLVFLLSGLMKIGAWDMTAGHMASKGFPAVTFFLTMAILVEVLGSAAVMAGLMTRWAALLLVAFLIPTTLIFHNFWALSGMDQQLQMSAFMKNVCIMGGLLVVAGFGPGRYSLDAWLERRRLQRRSAEPTRPRVPSMEGV